MLWVGLRRVELESGKVLGAEAASVEVFGSPSMTFLPLSTHVLS